MGLLREISSVKVLAPITNSKKSRIIASSEIDLLPVGVDIIINPKFNWNKDKINNKFEKINDFRKEVLDKELSPRQLKFKLQNSFSNKDFNVTIVANTKEHTPSRLIRLKDGANYGFVITFEAKNKKKEFTKKELNNFVSTVVPQLENILLQDTEFYKIIKN